MARGAVKVRDPYRVPLAQRLGNPALIRDSRPAPVSTSVTSADGQMGWHSTAWGYYDLVGEDHYYVTFYGSCFSRIGLRLGWLGDDEEPGPVYDEDGTPKDGIDPVLAELGTKAVRGLRARPGGQSGLMKSIGQNLSQTGKLYIVGHDKPSRHFEVCSTSELKASPNYIPGRDDTPRWAKVRRPGDNGVDLDPSTFVLPILNPHPQFKELPDSAIRPLLNVLERLALLDAEHLSLIRSRLANAGLWAVADEIELPPVPGASTDDEPFQAMLMKVAGAAMIDKSSPAAWLPIVVRMAKEFVKTGEGINVIDPPDPSKPKTAERRNAAVDDMARGVDLPPEALKGHANTTFCVDDETEALTERGWVRRDDLSVEDRVLTLRHGAGTATWEPVLAVNEFDVTDEPMLSIETKSHSSLTTAGHRWPVLMSDNARPRWRTSGGLPTSRLNTNSMVITAATGGAATEPKWSDDLVELVAWHYTEGHITRSGLGVITQSVKMNPEKVARIRGVLTRLVGPPSKGLLGHLGRVRAWYERQDPNHPVARFTLSRPLMADLNVLAPCKLPTPEFIRSLTPGQLELFLSVSRMADGWTTNSGTVMFAQKDPRAIDGYELAAILSGRTTSRWSRALGSGPYAETVMHYCSITDRTTCRPFISPLTGRGHAREWVSYTGVVWCPTTITGTWLARRRGRVYFTGNSNAYKIDEDTYKTHVAPLATVPTSVLTEGYLHPQLMGYLGLDPEDSEMPENVERLVIYPDAVALVGRPQMGDVVKWGVGTERQPNFVVSLAGARELTGIPDQMRPDDDEIAERLHRAQLLNARETVQGIPGENQDASGAEIPGVGPVTNGTKPAGASAYDRLALQIEVVADTLADRAVRRAGALLRNKVRGKDEHRAAMAGCDGDMARLPSALGSELCASLLSDSDPLAAERPTMEARVRAYAAESEHPDPEAVVAGAVGLLVALTRERMLRPGASVKVGQVAALVRAKA